MLRTGNRRGSSSKFIPVGVNLDGTNDYLTRGGAFTGAADGKVGLCSFWFWMQGGDGANQTIACNVVAGDVVRIQVNRTASNSIRVFGRNSGGSTVLTITTNATTYSSSMTGWKHFLAAWDLANTVGQIYISDTSDLAAGPTLTNDNIGYNTSVLNWAVGATAGGVTKTNALLSQVYLNIAETLDLSVEANRRKFITSSLKPVYLGKNGERPTGNQPILFLSAQPKQFSTWKTNKGSGGGMTENGEITKASSHP